MRVLLNVCILPNIYKILLKNLLVDAVKDRK